MISIELGQKLSTEFKTKSLANVNFCDDDSLSADEEDLPSTITEISWTGVNLNNSQVPPILSARKVPEGVLHRPVKQPVSNSNRRGAKSVAPFIAVNLPKESAGARQLGVSDDPINGDPNQRYHKP